MAPWTALLAAGVLVAAGRWLRGLIVAYTVA